MRTERTVKRRDVLRWAGPATAALAVTPAILALPGQQGGNESPTLEPGPPEHVGMSSERLEDVFARIARRVEDGLYPGATALIARHGVIVGHRAFGHKVHGQTNEPVTLDTMFDVLSMTKVVATAIAALVLVDEGEMALHEPASTWLPEMAVNGKGDITIHDMLRYASGLPVDNQLLDEPDRAAVWQHMAETSLAYPPGTQILYSDLAYRLLGRVIEAAAGMPLDAFVRMMVWGPLGMSSTMFKPAPALQHRIAATGPTDRRSYMVRGEVQDDQDFALGGVVGCDGVFSTARDMAVFCQMLLNRGRYGNTRILSRPLARAMVRNQTPEVDEAQAKLSPLNDLLVGPKGYGWEIWSPRFSTGGMRLSPKSYGKVGGAGTFMWVDPSRDLIGVLLTNHGLPFPFDGRNWNLLLDAVGCTEFYDGVIAAVEHP
ncbi:serine hydrolase domain-containing protein [Chondromyces apiculatus]|uniref:Beta-lactamase class C and other penicillin binding protein n=1 Tax=Chondromyces apiculatus DSM 436 TaxID=1192034 RepID=A0A017TFT6_9BACT|nr:serine hydrolase domain-containing protein [Chondromyces apiculatus]EYF07471.1 Beta-lactamase class C and other penicillin binding protein [Chondromyces apiculatus DSM 436]